MGGHAADRAGRSKDVSPCDRDDVKEGEGLAHDIGAEARLDISDPSEQVLIDAAVGVGVGSGAGTADMKDGVTRLVEDVLLLG